MCIKFRSSPSQDRMIPNGPGKLRNDPPTPKIRVTSNRNNSKLVWGNRHQMDTTNATIKCADRNRAGTHMCAKETCTI